MCRKPGCNATTCPASGPNDALDRHCSTDALRLARAGRRRRVRRTAAGRRHPGRRHRSTPLAGPCRTCCRGRLAADRCCCTAGHPHQPGLAAGAHSQRPLATAGCGSAGCALAPCTHARTHRAHPEGRRVGLHSEPAGAGGGGAHPAAPGGGAGLQPDRFFSRRIDALGSVHGSRQPARKPPRQRYGARAATGGRRRMAVRLLASLSASQPPAVGTRTGAPPTTSTARCWPLLPAGANPSAPKDCCTCARGTARNGD